MSHSCASILCDTPHYEECTCDRCAFCHETHDWRSWAVYPECEMCETQMLECWAEELREAA